MTPAYVNSLDFSFFSDTKQQLNTMITHLSSDIPLTQEHGTIEEYIRIQGHELLRCLLQAHLALRASQDNIINLQGKRLTHCRKNTKTTMTSLFGDVTVTRKGYSQHKVVSEYPLDGELNLAKDQFSDGLRLQLAEQVNHCAYDHAVAHINRTTGGKIAKRQCLGLIQDITQDFDTYYLKNRYKKQEDTSELLVLTFDGKGIVMRPDPLRECTKKKAKKSQKLNSRLSAGEKKDRKGMGERRARG